ncbi:hypothetical protein HYY75_08240, partial [bacterium]|nr:hypothetical protein [bacterium]
MFLLLRRQRLVMLLMALFIGFEPLVITIARAAEIPQPKPTRIDFNSLDPLKNAMEPEKYFEQILQTQGIVYGAMEGSKIKTALEAKAYAEFLDLVSNAYDLMDSGNSDAVTLVGALKNFNSAMSDPLTQSKGVADAAEKVSKAAGRNIKILDTFAEFIGRAGEKCLLFIGKLDQAHKPKWVKNLAKATHFSMKSTMAAGSKTFEFIQHMAPPENIHETKQFFQFIRPKGQPRELTKTQFTGRCIGIGLAVFTVLLETYNIASNDDTHGTKQLSWTNVKSAINIAVALASLAAMAFLPPVGTVVALVGLAIYLGTWLADQLGEYNRKWKAAYRRSFDFLRLEDAKFRQFYDNRSLVKAELRSAAWNKTISDFEENHLLNQNPVTEEDKKQCERNKELFDALEQQGVIMTYYNKSEFKIPNFNMDQLQEMWKMKASYMTHKPTQQEIKDEANKSTFAKVMDVISIWNYPKRIV